MRGDDIFRRLLTTTYVLGDSRHGGVWQGPNKMCPLFFAQNGVVGYTTRYGAAMHEVQVNEPLDGVCQPRCIIG